MKLYRSKRPAILTAFLYCLLYGLALFLILSVIRYRQNGPVSTDIRHIESVFASVDGGPWQTISLPHEFEGLPPRTPVTIRTTIHPDMDDCIYVKTIYSPAKVWLDGQLGWAMGQPESYPSFLVDPPAEIRLVETHGSGEAMDLQVDYLSPAARNSLIVFPFMQGTSKEIIFHCASRQAAPMMLAMVQIIVGCILIFVSIFLILIDSKGQVFFWLGLFSKFSGIWFLCENNFSVLCFKNDSLLYILAFVGLFSFMIPLLRFIRIVTDCMELKLLSAMELISAVAAIGAMLLQLTGLLPLSQSLYFFHFWIPLTLVVTTLIIGWKAIKLHNLYAGRLLIPFAILTLSALLGLSHYRLPITYVFSSMFQAGMFLFLLFISILAGLGFKDSLELKKKAILLDREKRILKIQTEEQRTHSLQLAQNEQELSRQRHDLRHQLAAIQELSGDNKPLQDYLAALSKKIPSAAKSYCDNMVVNAIVSHYAARCEQEGIALTTRLTVPETGSQDMDSDLCVIFANLLENAVEACGRMESGEKYIHLSSSLQKRMLAISMENSFNGVAAKIGGRFRSSKRDSYGIGLTSVQAIAASHQGSAEFQPHGTMFHSTVFLNL